MNPVDPNEATSAARIPSASSRSNRRRRRNVEPGRPDVGATATRAATSASASGTSRSRRPDDTRVRIGSARHLPTGEGRRSTPASRQPPLGRRAGGRRARRRCLRGRRRAPRRRVARRHDPRLRAPEHRHVRRAAARPTRRPASAAGQFLSKFPGFADQAALEGKLDEVLDQLVKGASKGDDRIRPTSSHGSRVSSAVALGPLPAASKITSDRRRSTSAPLPSVDQGSRWRAGVVRRGLQDGRRDDVDGDLQRRHGDPVRARRSTTGTRRPSRSSTARSGRRR